MELPMPRVTVVVFALKGISVLLCRRRSFIDYSTYALSGGYLEFSESFELCAVQDLREETSLQIIKPESRIMSLRKHQNPLTLHHRFPLANPDQLPLNLEAEECDESGLATGTLVLGSGEDGAKRLHPVSS